MDLVDIDVDHPVAGHRMWSGSSSTRERRLEDHIDLLAKHGLRRKEWLMLYPEGIELHPVEERRP